MKYPKAYQRSVETKLLWLYKCSIITWTQFIAAKTRYIEKLLGCDVYDKIKEA